jgi:hypothetical protein
MGDLSSVDAAANTKIVGSDPIGSETTMVASTANQDLCVDDSLRGTGGNQTTKTVTSAPIRASVGASNMANRKTLVVYADDDIFWGFTSSVTPLTGFPIYKKAPATIFAVGPECSIWLVASGTAIARIGESQ